MSDPEDEFAGLPEEEEEFQEEEEEEADGGGSGDGDAGGSGDGEGDGGGSGDGEGDGGGSGDGEGEGGSGGGGGSGDGEGEGGGSGDGDDASADSSEEEEDGENEYEADGFVVDEEEAEGSEGGSEGAGQEVRKTRKKKRRRNFALDEEDYELLEDNQVRVKRPQERKRLKRRGDDRDGPREKASGAKQLQEALFGTGDLEDELADLQDDRAGGGRSERSGGGGGSESAGGGGRGGAKQGGGGGGGGRGGYDDFGGELSDEMGDFIVDGEDGDRRRARRRRDARVAQETGLSAAAVQAANRLFGNFGELLDLHQSHRMYDRPDAAAAAEEDEADEDQEEEDEAAGLELDEDEADRRRAERQERAAARRQQRLLAQVDPELVDSHFLRPADQSIRTTDVPERLQLLGKSVLESVPEESRRALLDEAARWVADHLFGLHSQESKVRNVVEDGVLEVTGECPLRGGGGVPGHEGLWPPWMVEDVDPHIAGLDLRNNRALLVRRGKRFREYRDLSSEQRAAEERRILARWRGDPDEQARLRSSVRVVLESLFEKSEEVPLLAMYRKEACGELLSLRETDCPETTGNERKMISEADIRHPRGTIQAKHRRIRRWDVLWAVYNAGVKFMELYRRRVRRIESYNRAFDQASTEAQRDAIAACHELLTARMHTSAGMEDIEVKFRHIQEVTAAVSEPPVGNGAAPGGGAGGARRPTKPNPLKRLLRLGVGAAARKVCLSMDHFRENVDKREALNMPEDPPSAPLDWAKQQISDAGFDDPEERPRLGELASPQGYLDAVREVLAAELAAEPCLRQVVRNELYQHAVLSTSPTPAGEDALDPFHPLAIAKHLSAKKVSALEGTDAWLRVQAAERAGLVRLEITWPPEAMAASLSDVGELFVSDNTADVAWLWNEWRRGVLETAVRRRLLPALVAELRARLSADAVDTVLGQVADRFWGFVSQPPVRIMEVPDEQEQEPVPMEAPRFMAVVWGSGQPGDGPTTVVQLDGQGNLRDLLTAAQLSGNVPRTVNSGSREQPVFDPAADPKKSRDSNKLREKILEHKPNAILVATSSPQSKQIKDDMEKISQYTESDARFKEELLPHLENKRVEVMWADDQLAGLWANSEAAKAEFPDYSFLVRKAVGVGRMALDPLAIVSVLCGRRKEVLSLRLHDLQDRLPREALATRLEQTLITAVAQVGADINAMAANPWRQAPLQFVPGLGPRKARTLLSSIAANDNHIKTRVDLLKQDSDAVFGAASSAEVAQLGPCVFRNAAPFLRVRRGEVAALQNEEEFDALDDARIHPENEGLLQVILEEAFPDVAETGGAVDVRTATEAPGNLQQLDLWAVADTNNHLFKLPTLVDMLQELLAPYAELRLSGGVPSDEDAFFLRHGETRDSLKEGKLVEAKVVWVGETEVKVVIQSNNMEAFIPQAYASSRTATPILSQLFKHGQVVTARIKELGDSDDVSYDENQRRRYTVTLTTASKELNDNDTWEQRYCCSADRAYKPPPDKGRAAAAAAAAAAEAAQGGGDGAPRSGPRAPLQRRPIQHPLWRSARLAEVATELEPAPPGTAFFRPAHKPTVAEQLSQIALSIKLAQLSTGPLIYNVEVKEAANKPRKVARLVPPLRIEVAGQDQPETYDDLDEVVARFVEPMVEHAQEVVKHRRAMDGAFDTIAALLRGQLAGQPAGRPTAGVYCVALDSVRPGVGYVAFCGGAGGAGPGGSVHREYFSLTPSGFLFRKKVRQNLEELLDAFKRDPAYKKRQVEQQQRAAPGGGFGYGAAPAAAAAAQQQQQQMQMQMQQQAMPGQQRPPGGGGYGGYSGGGYGAPLPGPPAAAAAAGGGGYGGYGPPAAAAAMGGGYGAPLPGLPMQQQQQQQGGGGFMPPGGGYGAPPPGPPGAFGLPQPPGYGGGGGYGAPPPPPGYGGGGPPPGPPPQQGGYGAPPPPPPPYGGGPPAGGGYGGYGRR